MNTCGESFFPLTQSHMRIRPVIAIACLLALAPPVPRSFAQEGTEITVTVPPADADSKARPLAVQCWLPADCKYVRGIVVAHPMIKDVATTPLFRKVAVDESLGMICSGEVGGRTGKESMERLDKVFDEWARQSGHPEIRGAAVFTAGLSTSTLWARNVGYGAPDRVFGILNVSGGNMHQVMVDECKTLRGDFSEDYGAMSFLALEAIEKIAKDAEQPGARATMEAGVPRIVRATFFGTAENDDIQGVCVATDGTFYVAGNMGKSFEAVPGGAKALRMGSEASDPKCGHGYVAHFSADGGRILEYVELARGVAIMTSVQVTSNGVYVSGYASEAMEPLIGKLGGLMPKYPLVEEMRLVREGKIVEANGMYRAVEVRDETGRTNKVWEIAKADPCNQPVGLCRRGAPFVLRFSEDLQTLKGGTYLEGWQTVWVKQRQAQNGGYAGKGLMSEFFWQSTHIAALSIGDLVVCHDGGYFRILTDADRKHAGDNKYLLHHIGFYDVPDYLSRLSPDLSSRVFVSKIYTPATDKAVASRIRKYDWPYPHMSSPRTLGLRVDDQERVYVCGWSASLTSREPWWSPYIWQMSSADGGLIRKLEETDPMSGKDNRMGGSVADRAIGAVAIDGDEMVWNSYSDGGWKGVIHFSGNIGRKNLESGEKIGGSRVGPCMWAVDMAVAPRGRTLVLGRCNGSSAVTADAWQTPVPAENPVAWVRLYDRKMAFSFSTVLRGVVPYKIAALSKDRYAVVGEATLDTPVVKDAIQKKPQGKADGYLMVLEWKPGTADAAPAETDGK